MGKSGEDTKLIYDLADQGREILSLRWVLLPLLSGSRNETHLRTLDAGLIW